VSPRGWWASRPVWLGGRSGAHRARHHIELDGNGHEARARLAVEQVKLEREQVRTETARRTAGRLPAAADRFTSVLDQALGGMRQ